jgi:glutaredoxin 3
MLGARAAKRRWRLTSAVRVHTFSGMAKVEIYTKAFCPFCTRAMNLLTRKGAAVDEFDITMGGPKRGEMLERANGRTTVPQIFIDGQHIGGSDELAALDRDGKLDALLAA